MKWHFVCGVCILWEWLSLLWVEYTEQHLGNGHFDWLVQERSNSIANALELHLPCTNPFIYIHIPQIDKGHLGIPAQYQH